SLRGRQCPRRGLGFKTGKALSRLLLPKGGKIGETEKHMQKKTRSPFSANHWITFSENPYTLRAF
ncbi:MAG: hypothetical protein Q6366_006190, partial [Candidatus Freyarchaeota archaeon]